jgi:hypothetical protein
MKEGSTSLGRDEKTLTAEFMATAGFVMNNADTPADYS